MRRVQAIKQAGDIIGSRTKVRVVKNKVAPPFREAEFDIMYNEGISWAGDVLDLATEMDVIEKRGAYYSYGEARLGQGRENAKQFLRENPELTLEIENKVREMTGLPQRSYVPPAETADEAFASPEDEEENEDRGAFAPPTNGS